MTIGIDASRANKPQKTGVEWYSYHLIRELTRLSTAHTIRLYFREEPETGLQDLGPNVEYRILRWPFKYLWTQLRLSWEMLTRPPDILFVPAHIIPLLHPAKTVTTLHDIAFKPYPHAYRWRSRVYLDIATKLTRALPMLFTISHFSQREIARYYGIDQKKIIVTPLGFSHGPFETPIAVTTKYDIREPYLAYVGRLERKKNIVDLVRAFDLIKRESWGQRYQLVLIGIRGYGWAEIEKAIKRSDNKRDIRMPGWVTESEKHFILSRATALILLSSYEGFGIPLLEAMAVKTPVIASDQGALPEVAGDAAYQVRRGKPSMVRDALRDIVFNGELRNRLITNGMRRVKEFSWRETAVKTMAALDALAAHKL